MSVSLEPTTPPSTSAPSGGTGLGEPRLTTWHAVAQSMAIGPIYSTAIYGAFVAAIAGGVGPSVVVITSVGILALAWVVAQYARRFAGAFCSRPSPSNTSASIRAGAPVASAS